MLKLGDALVKVEGMMHSTLSQGLEPLKTIPEHRPRLRALWQALWERRFFKLIGGGSFTERDKIQELTSVYARAGADCLDIAPDPGVVDTVASVLAELCPSDPEDSAKGGAIASLVEPPWLPPVVMVSVPLDPDPHFRKIELNDPACIRCGLCLPVCPTEALTLPDALAVSQTLCYGCGRCVPVCPTEALYLLPFQVEVQIETVLRHPVVQAVEIHSRYVDPYMLEAFFIRWGALLQDKLISLCFRMEGIPETQILAFWEMAERCSPLPVMLQIDGAPMSGNDAPEASRPALDAAVALKTLFERRKLAMPPITISGGINEHTATLLREPAYAFIAGVGMGTVARKKIWTLEGARAVSVASDLVAAFKSR
jgi:ferredoxin